MEHCLGLFLTLELALHMLSKWSLVDLYLYYLVWISFILDFVDQDCCVRPAGASGPLWSYRPSESCSCGTAFNYRDTADWK